MIRKSTSSCLASYGKFIPQVPLVSQAKFFLRNQIKRLETVPLCLSSASLVAHQADNFVDGRLEVQADVQGLLPRILLRVKERSDLRRVPAHD